MAAAWDRVGVRFTVRQTRVLWPSAGHVEDLELDVVGIPEHDRVGHRLIDVDHAGMLDAEFVEPACPCVQAGAISDAE
jgi:hypothetical protein